MNRRLTTLALLLAAMGIAAQNPIIRDQFAADPTARVFDGRVYLYPSHDIPSPAGTRPDWFAMADYHVFSSDNLTDWTDHGVIINQTQVPWGNPEGYSMWAPDCVRKDGTYYFYFPDAIREGRGFGIGVATAPSPTGPFTVQPKPLAGVMGIDPCVLIDDDGQAYIYWGGMGIRGARLSADMMTVDAESIKPEVTPRGDTLMLAGQAMQGLPDGFKEGPFAFKRNGWYYLTFPWVRNEGGTETLAYAMSRTPLGPWQFRGVFMEEHDNSCWTNHHSFVEYRGEWYLFYHRNDYSPHMDKRRSPRIERFAFNADGTLPLIRPTMRGAGINAATSRIDVDRYDEAAKDVTTQYVDTANTFLGWQSTLPAKGSWLRYSNVDFTPLTDNAYIVINVKADANTEVLVRERKPSGKVIARIPVTVESQQGPFRRDMRGQWLTLTATLEHQPQGVTDICLVAQGAAVSVDWLQFKNRPLYFSPATSSATTPDSKGFIRRWTLRQPIAKQIASNTVFTDSYLRDLFAQELANLDAKRGRWHNLDSETFNVRLFRFGELYAGHTYGALFWAETLIDCPEDITDVRLAAGSNGASMWWIDGKEVLLLSGDRRMVEDDGRSARLTLTKGTHRLRCAVVNGPGLSDFCVRFLNEQGEAVTGYKVTLQ